MKHTYLDMVGKRYGKLVVQEVFYKPGSSRVYAKSICDCGNTHEGIARHILIGNTKSCGCMQKNDNLRKLRDKDILINVKQMGVSAYARQKGVSRELVYREIRRAKREQG